MGKYFDECRAFFDAKGIKYEVKDERCLAVSYSADNISSIRTLVIFDEDGENMVSLRAYNLIKVPEDKFAKMLVAVNNANNKYKWVKFTIDSELYINCEDDAILDLNSTGEEVYRLIGKIVGAAKGLFIEN